MAEYSREELTSIYELGRLYFEMGYFTPAERIFSGLMSVDNAQTYSRLGLGLVKLELGAFQEAATYFRMALQQEGCDLQAKLGLCAVFLAINEASRAQSLIGEVSKTLEGGREIDEEVRKLYEALAIRCRQL